MYGSTLNLGNGAMLNGYLDRESNVYTPRKTGLTKYFQKKKNNNEIILE